jgi:hypothetical protein
VHVAVRELLRPHPSKRRFLFHSATKSRAGIRFDKADRRQRSFAHRFITSSRAGMGRRRESLGAAPAEPIGKRAETLPQGASPAEAYGFVGFVLTGASSATTRDRGFRPQILVVTSRFSRRRIRAAAFRREGATSAATDAEARDTRTRRSPARALLTS